MDKDTLRADMRVRIAAIKPLQRALEEEVVNAAIMGSPEWRGASTVMVYKHKGPEFSVNSLANAAFRDGKRVCFPRVEGDRLTVHHVEGWAGLAPGSFGLDEPDAWTPQVDLDDIGVVVVPGLAWTERGDRLGRGGAYYDRLLPQIQGASFGVGFDVQVVEELPVQDHDVPVDRVWWASRITKT